jgi:tetratricopeptide (TPR) repeat protein
MNHGKLWLAAGCLGLSAMVLGGCQSPQIRLSKQGVTQYKAGDYPTAYLTFEKALSYDQFNAEDNYYAGMSAFRLGRYETAAYHLKLAWQADPSLGDVKDALTETLIRQGKADQALDFLDRDAELTAKVRDPSWMKRGSIHTDMTTEERMYLRKADDRCRVGAVYERLGDMDNAAINYERASKMAPNDPDILTTIGQFYARIGQRDKAAKLFTKAYNIDRETPGLAEAIKANDMVVK